MREPVADIPTRTGGRLLAANVLWNLAGQGIPVVVAVAAIPLLIHGLGTDRFGVLTLALIAIGYFGFFDIGLGRALTQLVARRLGSGDSSELPALIWSGILLMLGMGLVGSVLMAVASPWLAGDLLRIPSALDRDALAAFYLLAVSIPFVIATAGLRGVLEANQRFGMISVVRVGMGVFTYLGPIAVLPFSRSISIVVGVLVIGRIAAAVIHLLLCFSIMPELRHAVRLRWDMIPPLLRFGGWMTVSNIVGPLLTYVDRFLIGALISIAAVAYYATPYEVVTRLLIIPAALAGVLFPAFASSLTNERDRLARLFTRGVKYTFLSIFPIVLVAVVFAHEGLKVWLGAEFANHSTVVLQWLAVGVFLNSLAYVPFTLIQGIGRPDLTAKLHVLELALYIPGLLLLLRVHGIEGAAAAWAIRTSADALILFYLAHRLVAIPARSLATAALAIIGSFATLGLALIPANVALKGVFLGTALGIFCVASWMVVLSPQERALATFSTARGA